MARKVLQVALEAVLAGDPPGMEHEVEGPAELAAFRVGESADGTYGALATRL